MTTPRFHLDRRTHCQCGSELRDAHERSFGVCLDCVRAQNRNWDSAHGVSVRQGCVADGHLDDQGRFVVDRLSYPGR